MQEEELRERVVLAMDALGEPALGDREHLREEPGLNLAVERVIGRFRASLAVLAEVFLQGELGQQEGDLVGRGGS